MAALQLPAEAMQLLTECEDEAFDRFVDGLDMKGLLDLVSELQRLMAEEQSRFDMLSSRLQGCTDPEDHRRITAALCSSQMRLAVLCNRNMRCFTQQAVRAQKDQWKISRPSAESYSKSRKSPLVTIQKMSSPSVISDDENASSAFRESLRFFKNQEEKLRRSNSGVIVNGDETHENVCMNNGQISKKDVSRRTNASISVDNILNKVRNITISQSHKSSSVSKGHSNTTSVVNGNSNRTAHSSTKITPIISQSAFRDNRLTNKIDSTSLPNLTISNGDMKGTLSSRFNPRFEPVLDEVPQSASKPFAKQVDKHSSSVNGAKSSSYEILKDVIGLPNTRTPAIGECDGSTLQVLVQSSSSEVSAIRLRESGPCINNEVIKDSFMSSINRKAVAENVNISAAAKSGLSEKSTSRNRERAHKSIEVAGDAGSVRLINRETSETQKDLSTSQPMQNEGVCRNDEDVINTDTSRSAQENISLTSTPSRQNSMTCSDTVKIFDGSFSDGSFSISSSKENWQRAQRYSSVINGHCDNSDDASHSELGSSETSGDNTPVTSSLEQEAYDEVGDSCSLDKTCDSLESDYDPKDFVVHKTSFSDEYLEEMSEDAYSSVNEDYDVEHPDDLETEQPDIPSPDYISEDEDEEYHIHQGLSDCDGSEPVAVISSPAQYGVESRRCSFYPEEKELEVIYEEDEDDLGEDEDSYSDSCSDKDVCLPVLRLTENNVLNRSEFSCNATNHEGSNTSYESELSTDDGKCPSKYDASKDVTGCGNKHAVCEDFILPDREKWVPVNWDPTNLINDLYQLDAMMNLPPEFQCYKSSDSSLWEKTVSTPVIIHPLPFITPVFNPLPANKNVLIVDIGGVSIRAGLLMYEPTLPTLFFPAVCATDFKRQKHHFGKEVLVPSFRNSKQISHPFAHAEQTEFEYDVEKIHSLLLYICEKLHIHPVDYKVQLVLNYKLSYSKAEEILQMVLGDLRFKALNITLGTIAALQGYRSKTGIIIDMGDKIQVNVVCDGSIIEKGGSISWCGANRMIHHLCQELIKRDNISFDSDVEKFIIRYALEKLCYTAEGKYTKEDSLTAHVHKQGICIQDFFEETPPLREIVLEEARYEIVEGLFVPSVWGLDTESLPGMIRKALHSCPLDFRHEITQNIYLCGGFSLLSGLPQRLAKEVREFVSPKSVPTVHASKYRSHMAYLGCYDIVQSDEFESLCIHKSDFERTTFSYDGRWSD